MAKKAETPLNLTQTLLQQGFSRIDAAIAEGDPEMAAMIDDFIDKLSGPMARRQGVSAKALQRLTRHGIRGRAQQMAAEESSTRATKMNVAQTLGRSERGEQMNNMGLKLRGDAFDKQIALRYAGAAIGAAGAFIGQGIASGLFDDLSFGPGNDPDGSMPNPEDIDPDDLETLQDLTDKAYNTNELMDYTFMQEPNQIGTGDFDANPNLGEFSSVDSPAVKPTHNLSNLPSPMRKKDDKDKFAGILDALRGTGFGYG